MKNNSKERVAAAAIMATSAVGPGFLTQTTVFAELLLYNFGFVIMLSLVIDIVAQTTIWKTLTFAQSPVQQLADQLWKGAGRFLIVPIAFGGLVFNVGNLAGTGMGLQALLGIPMVWGMIISSILVGILFSTTHFLRPLDHFIKLMAVLMLVLVMLMALRSDIDLIKAIQYTFVPDQIDIKATITLVGGTVGGYITFAGAQRLLDAGIHDSRQVAASAAQGILFTGTFRYLLFFAVLSPALSGVALDPTNPTATVFKTFFGNSGEKLFGLMIWAASITSVIGATYTSLAFLKDLHPTFHKARMSWSFLFVVVSLAINLLFGKPVTLLVFAGYINAFILPFGMLVVLVWLWKRKSLGNRPVHPPMQVLGWITAALLFYFSFGSLL